MHLNSWRTKSFLWKLFEFVTPSNFIREIIFLRIYQRIVKIIKFQNWPAEKHLLHLAPGKDSKMYKSLKRKVSLCRNYQIQYIHINTRDIYEQFIFTNMLLLHYLPWLLCEDKRKAK